MNARYPSNRLLLSLLYILCLLTGSLFFIASFSNIGAEDISITYPITSSPFGSHYEVWASKFWQWYIAIPATDHPNTNYVAEKCSSGQDKNISVWFIAAPAVEEQVADRTCSIPMDKAILLGILSGECDTSDPLITTDDSIKQCATEGNNYGVIQVSFDGRDLNYDMNANRITSDYFNITIPQNNVFDAPSGTFRAVVDGYFLFLKPLVSGEHTLKFKVSVLNPTKPEYNYFQDVTYHLIIS